MDSGVIDIGGWQLLIAALLMLAAAAASFRFKLGLAKDIVISVVRVFLQLLALGLVLRFVFQFQTWWLVALLLCVMLVSAVLIARGRIGKGPRGLGFSLFLSLTVTSLTVSGLVVGVIIHPEPLWDARTAITITGMILGNSMSAVAVALDRLFADLDARDDQITAFIALGATAREAAQPSIRASIRAGLIPTLANMSAAGVVFIPGMMTGQILGGADPVMAAKYQIVVLLMISAATTVCNIIAVMMAYRRRFSDEGVYLSPGLRKEERA